MQKEMEAEGFEPPAFRKHLKQCKANVIPLHQAPVFLIFEMPDIVYDSHAEHRPSYSKEHTTLPDNPSIDLFGLKPC
jgi:hypothetical protein